MTELAAKLYILEHWILPMVLILLLLIFAIVLYIMLKLYGKWKPLDNAIDKFIKFLYKIGNK